MPIVQELWSHPLRAFDRTAQLELSAYGEFWLTR
jgi:hypothetical protein